ncbi:hypothetical protein [Roseovarius sp. EL26]|uniref:hypothetical protein n=1 Tax=Roseovarius sp. EL26 TaxID=2126672 RepID=UPI000EA273C5|nr:hypothetical protein [Roseovarius sp. EL26]
MQVLGKIATWFDDIFIDLIRQLRWSYVPPLMVYFAYGLATISGITGTFFVKEYLDLSAAYLAGLGFWAGIPWALKMPLGHLVDILWRHKAWLLWLGAALTALSFFIMYLVLTAPEMMSAIAPLKSWFIASTIIAPSGLVLQDAVADAMSVEAVPRTDDTGTPIDHDTSRMMHTTMQTLGRFALIFGTVVVAVVNITMFAGIEALDQAQKSTVYANIYLIGLVIPLISVSGILIAAGQRRSRRKRMQLQGLSAQAITAALDTPDEPTTPNPWYFIGGAGFVAITLIVGLGQVPYGQEIIFLGSLIIVSLLMRQLLTVLPVAQARALVGTALILFVFRATPRPGDGQTWFSIDILGFDQQFLSLLSFITSALTLVGLVILRPLMASRSVTAIVAILTVAAGILSLPNIGLYYGIQNWTAALTGGVVDARFIAILDTAVESPLGQVAVIPMLAWIARNAPANLKATFFAVMASFTNLALSASALLTKYLNEIFIVTREVTDNTGAVTTAADYSQLGILLIVVTLITVGAPLLTIALIQNSRLRTGD